MQQHRREFTLAAKNDKNKNNVRGKPPTGGNGKGSDKKKKSVTVKRPGQDHAMTIKVETVPSTYASTTQRRPPTYKTTKQGIIVKHSEYFQSLKGTQEFSSYFHRVNPSNEEVFPWLNMVSQNYDKFKIRKMAFRFVSASNVQVGGNVYMYVNYQANQPAIPSFPDILNCFGAKTGLPYKNLDINVVSSKFNQTKSYLTASAFDQVDQTSEKALWFYPCSIQFGSWGVQTTPFGEAPLLGQVYVDYEIELEIPVTSKSANVKSCGYDTRDVINPVTTNVFQWNLTGDQWYVPQLNDTLTLQTNSFAIIEPENLTLLAVKSQDGFLKIGERFCGLMTISFFGAESQLTCAGFLPILKLRKPDHNTITLVDVIAEQDTPYLMASWMLQINDLDGDELYWEEKPVGDEGDKEGLIWCNSANLDTPFTFKVIFASMLPSSKMTEFEN